MSRIKHVIQLIIKIVFIFACFTLSIVYNAIVNYSTDDLDITGALPDEGSVLFTAKSGVANYEIKDGAIVVTIEEEGAKYDDIYLILIAPEAKYDPSYLKEMLGKRASKYEDYIAAMEEGPWMGKLRFLLTSDKRGQYTVHDPDDGTYTFDVASARATEHDHTDEIKASKGEALVSMVTFGAEGSGSLPAGTYTLSADYSFSGLADENEEKPSVSFLDKVGIIARISWKALKAQGVKGLFTVNNWLVFYGAVCLFGTFIFLYRDTINVLKFIKAVYHGSDMGPVVYNIYVNGVYSGTVTESSAGASLALAILFGALFTALLIITLPIRLLVNIVMDIVHLFKKDEAIQGYSLIGNVLGSVGVYAFAFGIMALISASYIVGGVALGIGAVLLAVGTVLCRLVAKKNAA